MASMTVGPLQRPLHCMKRSNNGYRSFRMVCHPLESTFLSMCETKASVVAGLAGSVCFCDEGCAGCEAMLAAKVYSDGWQAFHSKPRRATKEVAGACWESAYV